MVYTHTHTREINKPDFFFDVHPVAQKLRRKKNTRVDLSLYVPARFRVNETLNGLENVDEFSIPFRGSNIGGDLVQNMLVGSQLRLLNTCRSHMET